MRIENEMNELSLFTGIGGGLLGTKLLGWRCIGAVEWDEYCCKVLEQRIKDGCFEQFDIFNMDIREFNRRVAAIYRGKVDVITAGFPCQPFSLAGKRLGDQDERNMWLATIECIRLVRPQYLLLENVPGLLTHEYVRRIYGDLAESGYCVKWRCLSAAEVGANHKRNRWWIVANADNGGRGQTGYLQGQRQADTESSQRRHSVPTRTSELSKVVSNTIGGRLGKGSERLRRKEGSDPNRRSEEPNVAESEGERCRETRADSERPSERTSRSGKIPNTEQSGLPEFTQRQFGSISESEEAPEGSTTDRRNSETEQRNWWSVEPDVGRLADGVPNRVQRLRAIGNAQVPAVAAAVWRLLNEN